MKKQSAERQMDREEGQVAWPETDTVEIRSADDHDHQMNTQQSEIGKKKR